MAKLDARARLAALEAVFAALAHPARRQIVLTIHLRGGAMSAGDVAARFACAWPTTTRHLQVLEAAGLLAHERRGRNRVYRLDRAWLGLVPKSHTASPANNLTEEDRTACAHEKVVRLLCSRNDVASRHAVWPALSSIPARPQRPDCVAGVVGLEPRNPRAGYVTWNLVTTQLEFGPNLGPETVRV